MVKQEAILAKPWLKGAILALCILLSGLSGLFGLTSLAAAQGERTALVLEINGAIGPATADYIARGLTRADETGAPLVILQMDTPGGLDSSMRNIVRDILRSPSPVATYVSPGGARAASAGAFILYASHIAAMAPGTNVGAATPPDRRLRPLNAASGGREQGCGGQGTSFGVVKRDQGDQ